MSTPADPATVGSDGTLSPVVVNRAFEWLVVLWSGVATPEDHAACARWREAHADHERAWQKLQTIDRRLELIRQGGAEATLTSPSVALKRRRVLKVLAVLLAGGAATQAVRRTAAWEHYTADYRTRTGESRSIVLADASHVMLNTASAIDVQFDGRERRIELLSGEILVKTSHDSASVARPFSVRTAQGSVQALGTRFTVRRMDGEISHVAVFEGAVLIQPKDAASAGSRLEAGQQASFSRRAGFGLAPADESAAAWTRGSLMVERMRLDAFLEELSRYRPGVLRCDPDAGHYLLTGVYPLGDTDRILASVEKALPVRVTYRSRYWVTVEPREAAAP